MKNKYIISISNFGLISAIKYAVWRALKKAGLVLENDIKPLNIKRLKTYVWYRPGTSDSDVLLEFFWKQNKPLQYDFNIEEILEYNKVEYVLDAGANIGLYSLLCNAQYHPAVIIGVEPEYANFQLYKKNTESKENIHCINGGIWSRTSYLQVIPSKMGNWGFTVKECDETQADTKGYSIKELMEKYNIPHFDIIKMDIEGSEYYVFSDDNCEEWINKCKVLIIETHDRKIPGCTEVVMKRMGKFGYHYFLHGENYVFYK